MAPSADQGAASVTQARLQDHRDQHREHRHQRQTHGDHHREQTQRRKIQTHSRTCTQPRISAALLVGLAAMALVSVARVPIAAAASLAAAVPFGIPLPANTSLPWGHAFYDQSSPQAVAAGGCGFAFFMYWNVSDAGLPSEAINVLLTVQAPSASALTNAWFGIGFGQSMLSAQFVVCQQTGDASGSVTVKEYTTQQRYAPPNPLSPGQPSIITPISGGSFDKQAVCLFSRPTVPPDASHATINVNDPVDIIWAFDPKPVINYRGKYFSSHGEHHRGAALVKWSTGAAENTPIVSFVAKQIHGFGMIGVWLLLFPLGAWYARYFRFVPGWIYIKVSIQISGIVGVVAFFIVILNDVIYLDRPHTILGLIIISFIFCQTFLGVFSLLGLAMEGLQSSHRIVRMSHYVIGFGILLAAVAQIILGLDTLYPWVEPRGKEAWYTVFVAVAFWVLMFTGAEIFWRFRVMRVDSLTTGKSGLGSALAATEYGAAPMTDMAEKDHVSGGAGSKISKRKRFVASRTGAGKTHEFEATLSRPLTEKFTWESLDCAITQAGRMLVVGNGRYVYDISRWILSHPGGQIILHAVNGTDISNDYFHEAGFDAAEFTPKIEAPAQRAGRHGGMLPRPRNSQPFSDTGSNSIRSWDVGSPSNASVDFLRDLSGLSESDWNRVLKARRTHVHTRLAIERLAQLIVGEIRPSPEAVERYQSRAQSSQTLDTEDIAIHSGSPLFDRYEYRRYAMTSKAIIGSNVGSNAASPIVRVRFCLLYPHETREATPREFVPGECIEIQSRIDGRIVSRYYTPLVGGDLTAFEIVFRVCPRGAMSPFLARQRCGDRQFKIRGPFGSPIVSVDRPLRENASQWMPPRLIFVSGGTGITPFLQLLSYVFLPTLEKLRVVVDYQPGFEDELKLSVGDTVIAKHHYYDGWAHGVNLNSRTEGVFPLSCTAPRCGPRPRVVLINAIRNMSDIAGKDMIEGALLAYPQQIQVHHFVASLSPNAMPSSPASSFTLTSPTSPVSPTSSSNTPLMSGNATFALTTQSTTPVTSPTPMQSNDPYLVADIPGNVYSGRLTEHRLANILTPLWDHNNVGSQRCIVCGPTEFSSFVVDALMDYGVHNSETLILPSNRWVENN